MKMLCLTIQLLTFALCSYSSPISSSLGARSIFGSSKVEVEYTASNYVQEGLIAIWDGIENAGYGLHDDNIEYWINLVGLGSDWLIRDSHTPEVFEIDDDYVKILSTISYDGRGYCTPTWENSDDIVCCELVIDNTDFDTTVNNARQLVSFAVNGDRTGNRSIYMCGMNLCTRYNTYPMIVLVKGTNFISLDFGEQSAFVNGNIVVGNKSLFAITPPGKPILSGYGYGDAYCAIGVKIKCMRLYGRSLTLEERKYNWMIDKARFGL